MGGMAGHCMAWVEYSRQIGRGLHSKWGSECPPLSILPKVSGGNGGMGGRGLKVMTLVQWFGCRYEVREVSHIGTIRVLGAFISLCILEQNV